MWSAHPRWPRRAWSRRVHRHQAALARQQVDRTTPEKVSGHACYCSTGLRLGKWSGAAIAAAVFGGAWLAAPPDAKAGAWINRRGYGGGGGGWINGRGYGGGGAWVNRRAYGGGGAWVNRW